MTVESTQLSFFENDNAEYEKFAEKFKPKLTTDDCYTPPEVYDAVRDWACREYGFSPDRIVRPFYPGGDFERFEYPADCVVLDNPPFSILSKIKKFYVQRNIKFFLFAPALTLFSTAGGAENQIVHLVADANIQYLNGAVVRTSFVTNLGNADIYALTEPELKQAVDAASARIRARTVRQLPKYAYPDHVTTAARMNWYTNYGVRFSVPRDECIRIAALDSQRSAGKAIYGAGLLLSDRCAEQQRIAAEKAAAEKTVNAWTLSARERELVKRLSKMEADNEQ